MANGERRLRRVTGASCKYNAATFIAMNGYRDYAVGWFTLALINAGLAQGKKRSGALWFIVSLFLGPIATFVIVITDSEA